MNYLRLSVTDQCNLRCHYCMPNCESTPQENAALSTDQIVRLVDAFAQNGITKVRITGGEPLVREDIVEIVRSIVPIHGIEAVGLTTNGMRLDELAADLFAAGLSLLNISLDTLNHDTYRKITGSDLLDSAIRGIESATRYGFKRIRINTVVMRGINALELPDIADLTRIWPVEVRFIELMPLRHTTEEWERRYVSAAEIREILGLSRPHPSDDSSSARRYDLPSVGVVGIISPMSEPFCDKCNRLRVTSSASLKPCLRLPIQEDLMPILDEPHLVQRLGEIIRRLSGCKLIGTSEVPISVETDSMSCVGG
jgi:GTP 3',8-cyclase